MSFPPPFQKKGNLSRDRAATSEPVETPNERMGILSLTHVPSPVVRWILRARIRSHSRNDVVFIGSTYIQLREFQPNGQLSDTTAKLDFGTQILAARVISAKVESVPTLDAILGQERDEERFTIKGRPCADDQPPQIVVLVTASSELVYIYAKDCHGGKDVELVFAKRALLQDVSIPDRHLRHMAIDPECKIMATASYSTCTVFSLKEVDDLKSSIDAWDPRRPQSFQPNFEQRMFQVNGHILKMDFLRASEDEPDRAILLLVVANAGRTHLLLYQWDTKEPLNQVRPMNGIVEELEPMGTFPQLLIPSRKRMSFGVVTGDTVTFYDNHRCHNPSHASHTLPSASQGKHEQLWVQYAKPSRHDQYNNAHEDILLVRDDGSLRVVTRPVNGAAPFNATFFPGMVEIGVDSAVCMLPGPRDTGGDVLVVGGCMSDGGVFHLPPRRSLYSLQNIPNVSPIHDIAMLEDMTFKQRGTRSRRTFVTAGIPGASSLNELRFGLEAQIGSTIPLMDSETLSRVWALEHVPSGKLLILGSHPERTSAIALDLKTEHLEEMDVSDYHGLQLDAVTLAAEMLVSGIGVQITTKCIAAGFETHLPAMQSVEDGICADIDHESGVFAIAYRTGFRYHISVGLISCMNERPSIVLSSATYHTDNRPLCMALFYFEKRHYLAVGYFEGHTEMYSIDAEGQLMSECILASTQTDVSAISSIVVLDRAYTSSALVLAGTRDGKLKVIKATLKSELTGKKFTCTLDRTYQIGTTSVTVVKEDRIKDHNKSSAFVKCESRLDQIICFNYDNEIDYFLTHIWVTKRNDLTYRHPNLNAVQRIRYLASTEGGDPSNALLCATKDEYFFAKLISQEQMVPRRLTLSEKGARLVVYSKYLKKLVIASDPIESAGQVEKSSDLWKRHSTLHVVSTDEGADADADADAVKVILGERKERVKFLLPWEPTDGKSHYDFIVVGLNDQTNSRIGYVSARKLSGHSAGASLKGVMRFTKKQLHAACAVDKSCLAISVGHEVVLLRLNFRSKKWHQDFSYTVPSPALSLAARGTVIYAATELHSTVIFNWRRKARTCEAVFTDHAAKNARTVLPFGKNGEHVLVSTASGQGTSVAAYSIKKNSSKPSTPLFEAAIPLGIEHIASIPSSWTEQTQHAFQGTAFDGTVFILQTLAMKEWRLLRFVEQLAHPDPVKPVKRPMALLTGRLAHRYIRAEKEERVARFNSKRMHVNGDVLKRLVANGPQSLRNLLGTQIKNEDVMDVDGESNATSKLESLARPVVGEVDDVAAAVIAWTRKMLRATIF